MGELSETSRNILLASALPGIYCLMFLIGRRLKRTHRVRLGWSYHLFSLSLAALVVALVGGLGGSFLPHLITAVAAFIVLMHLLDNYWNVEPAYHSRVYVHWLDFAAPIGLGGVWVGLLLRQIKRCPLVPEHDPRIAEALEKAL